jgi:transglutaminase-like putative cysteine protease
MRMMVMAGRAQRHACRQMGGARHVAGRPHCGGHGADRRLVVEPEHQDGFLGFGPGQRLLHPKASADIGETVEGESHAWLEWWVGDWVGYDPTSLTDAGTDHVLVARGRDYTDVTPLKGIYAGSTGSTLFVSVQVTRLA